MPRLSVEFELAVPSDTKQKGAQAGAQFAQGFTQGAGNLSKSGLAQAMEFANKMNPASASAFLANLGISRGTPITPPGLAPAASAFQKMLNLPPLFRQQESRLKNLILGAGAAPFSSWIGARMLSSAAFGSGGGGGGGHGLLGGGGASGFAEFFIGIEALKKAFEYGAEKIKEVVERGFNLYVKAGQLRQSVGNLFALQEAGKQVGLSESQIDQFLLRNQWGRAKTSLQNFGVLSGLSGLSGDFKEAYKWASEIQGKWQDTARTSYEIQVSFERIKTDWLTMWNDSSFLKGIDMLAKWTDAALHFEAKQKPQSRFNSIMQAFFDPNLINIISAIGAGSTAGSGAGAGIAPLFNLPRSLPQMSSFEKMGFNIGGGKVPDKLDRANNLLQAILTGINGIVHNAIAANSHHPSGSSGALINVP